MRTDPCWPEVAGRSMDRCASRFVNTPTALPSVVRHITNLVDRIRSRVVYSDSLE
jgi:hypothetical protein